MANSPNNCLPMTVTKRAVFFLLSLSIFLTGCAGLFSNLPDPLHIFTLKKSLNGVYHRVKKGQTLWRISRTYKIPLEEIVKINRISDARRIHIGQRIFIPGEKTAKKVSTYQPKYKTRKKRSQRVRSRQKTPEIPDLAKGDFIWPVKGRLSSYYGKRKRGFHHGIDIAGPRGRAVRASRAGVIAYSGVMRGYGNVIIIDHNDGFSTVYAHNRENLVKEKDKVKQGRLIAKLGSTGRSTGNHLHFEIRKGAKTVNPLFYLP